MSIMKSLQDILGELHHTLNMIDKNQITACAQEIQTSRRTFVGGAGRSGLMMRAFAMRLMHLGFPVFVLGETITPGIERRDLLLLGTGSGTTSSLVTYASKAKSLGARVGVITIRTHSLIASDSDFQINIPAPSSKIDSASFNTSLQPMGSLFEQSLLLVTDIIVAKLMESTSQDSAEMFVRHANLE